MNKEITAQVVMLPTNSNNSHIGILKRNIDIINPLIYNSVGIFNTFAWSSQHLYFTRDEPIQKGDWCYSIRAEMIFQAPDLSKDLLGSGVRKIIASTDPALGLPAIPLTWIKDVYVPSNGSIKKVELKMVEIDESSFTHHCFVLKLTPNNEVVIVDEPVAFKLTKETAKMAQNAADPDGSIRAKITNILYSKVDQELEDAALSYFMLHPLPNMQHKIENAFKAGVEWQKEQSAIDAIEFAEWTHKNLWAPINNDGLWYNKSKVYQYKTECLTTKQLYELWQKIKEK